jgi:uncharacterized damage-inducible protein DinB
MPHPENNRGRRDFIKKSVCLSASFATPALFGGSNNKTSAEDLFVIGPIEGYSPQIGTLVSMLNYNRFTVVSLVRALGIDEIDYLHDADSNSIAALLMHLGAIEKYYQINTFEGRTDYNESEKKIWSAARELGDEGRTKIKGKEVAYYLNLISEVRQQTLRELKNKDDDWLLAVDPKISSRGNINTYWKWFHVCEHESHHRGQIAWLTSRLPNGGRSKD